MKQVRYTGRAYRAFFGTAPYKVHRGVHGYYIYDTDGDRYYVYRSDRLEADWEWVEDEAVWIDYNKQPQLIHTLSNWYLLNLIPFIMKGGGYAKYITVKLGASIFREVENRNLDVEVTKKDFISVCQQREDEYNLFIKVSEDEGK